MTDICDFKVLCQGLRRVAELLDDAQVLLDHTLETGGLRRSGDDCEALRTAAARINPELERTMGWVDCAVGETLRLIPLPPCPTCGSPVTVEDVVGDYGLRCPKCGLLIIVDSTAAVRSAWLERCGQ